MAKQDRHGQRKLRSERQGTRTPYLGYYLIIVDTERTEECYFHGLRDSLPKSFKNRLVISVHQAETKSMIAECKRLKEYSSHDRIPWIVFDRDEVKNFDGIIDEAQKENINVGWSNPCFEIWLYAYFGKMPTVQNSWSCCDEFARLYRKRTRQVYSKSDSKLYKKICEHGNEEQAIQIAEQKMQQYEREGKKKPSEMCSASTVYKLVDEIRNKVRPV